MKKVLFSLLGGIISGIFVCLILESWSIHNILVSNPDIWEVIRVRGIEVIGIIGGFAIGSTGTWQIITNIQEMGRLIDEFRGRSNE